MVSDSSEKSGSVWMIVVSYSGRKSGSVGMFVVIHIEQVVQLGYLW